ncbi:MAG: radical SAM protein [Acidobacteriota bacterium]|nr:radical SAM protein [Acidobacteriota bacterium]
MRHVQNPANPWLSTSVEYIGEPPRAETEVFEEDATRTVINKVESPDVAGFMPWTVNVYRGCQHACTYCFSRPTHEYLGFGAGTDFDRKIVVKVRAPELLRHELMRPSWKGEVITFSFTSDPYLPLESNYKLTRSCLEVCLEFRQPVSVVTKSALVRRDVDVLSQLAREADAEVWFTIPFKDNESSRPFEPHAPNPESRWKAMAELSAAGVRVGVGIAPIILSYNDSHVPEILRRSKEAGATRAFMSMLRLPGSVKEYFVERLREDLPTKADRIINRILEARGGRLNSSEFVERMRGIANSGVWSSRSSSCTAHA